MDPQGPWKETFNVAAVGSGLVLGVLLIAIIVVMVIHPTECSGAGCHETDTQAAVQVVFLAPLLAPIYVLVLPGAAIGRLLGRLVARRAGR